MKDVCICAFLIDCVILKNILNTTNFDLNIRFPCHNNAENKCELTYRISRDVEHCFQKDLKEGWLSNRIQRYSSANDSL